MRAVTTCGDPSLGWGYSGPARVVFVASKDIPKYTSMTWDYHTARHWDKFLCSAERHKAIDGSWED